MENAWETLSERSPSPFLTHGWLAAWWRSYGAGVPEVAALHGEDGRLRAAALLRRTRFGGLAAAANVHSGDWDAVAEDDDARAELWDGPRAGRGAQPPDARPPARHRARPAARAPAARLPPPRDPGRPQPLPRAARRLRAAPRRASSRNLRSQVRRRRRQLAERGELTFRTHDRRATASTPTSTSSSASRRSGWKARAGTAILREPGAEPLYRGLRPRGRRPRLAARVPARGRRQGHRGRPRLRDRRRGLSHQDRLRRGAGASCHPAWSCAATCSRRRSRRACAATTSSAPTTTTSCAGPRPSARATTLHAFRGAAAAPGLAWHRAIRPALKRARDQRCSRFRPTKPRRLSSGHGVARVEQPDLARRRGRSAGGRPPRRGAGPAAPIAARRPPRGSRARGRPASRPAADRRLRPRVLARQRRHEPRATRPPRSRPPAPTASGAARWPR